MSDILVEFITVLLGTLSFFSTVPAEHQQPKPVFHQDVAWSADGSKLLFSSNQEGNFEIWLADPDGSNPINLTQNPARDVYGVWSPDGQTIAFASDRDGHDAIYLMQLDGSGLQRLTDPEDRSSFPTWSPGGHVDLDPAATAGGTDKIRVYPRSSAANSIVSAYYQVATASCSVPALC